MIFKRDLIEALEQDLCPHCHRCHMELKHIIRVGFMKTEIYLCPGCESLLAYEYSLTKFKKDNIEEWEIEGNKLTKPQKSYDEYAKKIQEEEERNREQDCRAGVYRVYAPNGDISTVKNLRKFCDKIGTNMSTLYGGYKGWRIERIG